MQVYQNQLFKAEPGTSLLKHYEYTRVTDDQLCMVSKVLSGSVDKFDKVSNSTVTKANTKAEDKVTIPPSVEVDTDIADVKPTIPLSPTNLAEGTFASNYYNCTVNMFQGQGPQSPPYYWQSRIPYQPPSLVPYQPFPIYDQFAGDLPYNTIDIRRHGCETTLYTHIKIHK